MAGKPSSDSGSLTAFGVSFGTALTVGAATAATLAFFPPALPAVLGFSMFGFTPFAFAASMSFVAQVSALSAIAAVSVGFSTAAASAIVKGFSSWFSWMGSANTAQDSVASSSPSSVDASPKTSPSMSKLGSNPTSPLLDNVESPETLYFEKAPQHETGNTIDETPAVDTAKFTGTSPL